MEFTKHAGTPVGLTLVEVRGREVEDVVPLLLLAEPLESSLRWQMELNGRRGEATR